MNETPTISQLDHLYFRLHDLQECITIKTIILELQVSRKLAIILLESVPYYTRQGEVLLPTTYEIKRMKIGETKDVFNVKLLKEEIIVQTGDESPLPQNNIFSVSLSHVMNVELGNQLTTLSLRNMMKKCPNDKLKFLFDPLSNKLEDDYDFEKVDFRTTEKSKNLDDEESFTWKDFEKRKNSHYLIRQGCK